MSVRLRVEHAVRTRYAVPVVLGHHEVRAAPATVPGQRPLRTRLDVDPSPWSATHEDRWGTRVTVLEVAAPHQRLDVVSTSVLEVDRGGAALPGGSWAQVRAADDAHGEHLASHPRTEAPDDLAGAAAAMAFDGAWPDDTALAVCALVGSRVDWDGRGVAPAPAPGAAASAWAAGSGDAGDLAHLTVGALRAAGLAARCVVGLAHPDGPSGAIPGEGAATELHAWVEWFSGAWYAWDVVRAAPPGDLHVVLGTARATTDVPVLRGVVALPDGAGPDVTADPVTETGATLTLLA